MRRSRDPPENHRARPATRLWPKTAHRSGKPRWTPRPGQFGPQRTPASARGNPCQRPAAAPVFDPKRRAPPAARQPPAAPATRRPRPAAPPTSPCVHPNRPASANRRQSASRTPCPWSTRLAQVPAARPRASAGYWPSSWWSQNVARKQRRPARPRPVGPAASAAHKAPAPRRHWDEAPGRRSPDVSSPSPCASCCQ